MTERENLLSLLRRQGYERIPVEYSMCPSLSERFGEFLEAHGHEYPAGYFDPPWQNAEGDRATPSDIARFDRYHDPKLLTDPAYSVDNWGVGHLKTPTSMHMTQMFHPLESASTVEEIEAYPLGSYDIDALLPAVRESVEAAQQKGLASLGNMQCTIWECAWYIRSMEALMMDMLSDGEMAAAMLDKVTELSEQRARLFARAGVDILFLGDDIGMQSSIMMSEELYCEWLKPRLARVISAAKAEKPDLLVAYHSCGYVEPFIPHLIEVGIDILNPVQPECMDFAELHRQYGDRLSFHGTIGTQTTMPFGTPGEVKATVERNLRTAGEKGGLLAAPTHLLEPEVPVENVVAYVEACRNFVL
ncbi:MAG: uroporphyrinogen decarboxylase family protein [Oscillospiraceae bacterium]